MEFAETPFQVCPICATRVGMDLIGHLTMQHGSYFKISFTMLLLLITCIFTFSHYTTVEDT